MTCPHRAAPVGIMADSHGRPDTIASAAAYLKAHACATLIHLGDVCDSLHPETAGACIDLIKTHGIIALKGNNDHSMAGNLSGRKDRADLRAAADYLRSLPLVHHHQNAIFTHSRPFLEELGPVALIGSMGPAETRRFFAVSPEAILFRGHAHAPGIMWAKARDIVSRPMAAGDTITLRVKIPCVVTCGALTHGFCMIWHPQDERLTCHRFEDTAIEPDR